MPFTSLLVEFRTRFPQHGTFPLLPGGMIRDAVAEHGVPQKPAAYVVSAVTAHGQQIAYIGMSGTLNTDATWQGQMLRGRLCNRANANESRQAFWQRIIAETGAKHLLFEWFVTVTDRITLPVLAESQLLQAYLDQHGQLPPYNACA